MHDEAASKVEQTPGRIEANPSTQTQEIDMAQKALDAEKAKVTDGNDLSDNQMNSQNEFLPRLPVTNRQPFNQKDLQDQSQAKGRDQYLQPSEILAAAGRDQETQLHQQIMMTERNQYIQPQPMNSHQISFQQQMAAATGNAQTHRSQFNSNDGTVLQNRIRELQAELQLLDNEEAELENEAEILQEETESIKRHNKALFDQITQNQEKQMMVSGSPAHPSNDIGLPQNSLYSAANDSLHQSTLNDSSKNLQPQNQSYMQTSMAGESNAAVARLQEQSVGDIHSLYQDLFLTDIKREVESVQHELKSCKQEQNNAQREYTALRKENAQLNATLKRYRRQLQELSWKQGQAQAQLNPGNLGKIGKLDGQNNSVGLGSNTPRAGGLKRQDSQSSIRSKQSQLTNQISTMLDSNRIERLLQALNTIQNCKKPTDIIKTTLKEIKSLISFSNCTIFTLSPELVTAVMAFRPDVDHVNVATLSVDNKSCKSITEAETIASPCFQKLDEVRYGLKNQNHLAHPVVFKEDEILFVIQCESRIIKRQNKHVGFHQADEQVLKILCSYLAMQIEKIKTKQEVNKKEQAVIDTLQLTSEVCTQRSFSGLFKKMCEFMPKYFGFEAVGALVFNQETGQLFSDPVSQIHVEDEEAPENLSDDDDDTRLNHNSKVAVDMATPTMLKKPDPMNSSHKQPAKAKAQADESVSNEPQTVQQRLEELHSQQATQFVVFPANIGLSGHVFMSGQFIQCNDAEKEPGFVDQIDNQPKVRNVRNFMIGPVYGEPKPGETERKPNGIIQFINKKGDGAIDATDKRRFNEIAELLGMCIENTSNVTKTIGVTLKLNSVMERISNIMDSESQLGEDMPTLELLQQVGKSMKEIKDQSSKLIEQRSKVII